MGNKPSIIMIVVDTLRADFLSCYGHSEPLTEQIDRLALGGARFEKVFSASNFTAPAFASLFTSLYPTHHGVYDFNIKRLPESPLMRAVGDAGYTRQAIVDFGFFKSYLGASFDHMESLTDLGPNWSTEGPVLETERAVEWIERHYDSPFFLFFHISPPHTPYRFPEEYAGILSASQHCADGMARLRGHDVLGTLLPVPEGGRIADDKIDAFNRCAPLIAGMDVDDEYIDIIKRIYRMEVKVVDDMIGRVLKGLAGLGIEGETIVSVSSDHGEEFWEHGGFSHGDSAMHNEVIRTPWIVSCPDLIGGGIEIDRNVSHTNILPTLMDLAGIDIPSAAQRKSVRRLIDAGGDTTGHVLTNKPVYCETMSRISVIEGDFKLIAPNERARYRGTRERLKYRLSRAKKRLSGTGSADVELFDLRNDPGETVNIAAHNPDTVKRLSSLIDAYHSSDDTAFGSGDDLSPEEEERIKKELEGLGYY
jgi:arylsulfatase A-like enzyme